VHVAAQRVPRTRRDGEVAGEEGRQRMRFGDDRHAPVGRRGACAIVVVAANEDNGKRRMQRPPFPVRVVKGIYPARRSVQEIAEDDETPGPGLMQNGRESRQIRRGAAARQRYAAGTKRRRLSQMHIGHEHGALAWPVQRARGEQLDPFPADCGCVHAIDIRCGDGNTEIEIGTGSWHDGSQRILTARYRLHRDRFRVGA